MGKEITHLNYSALPKGSYTVIVALPQASPSDPIKWGPLGACDSLSEAKLVAAQAVERMYSRACVVSVECEYVQARRAVSVDRSGKLNPEDPAPVVKFPKRD